MPVSDSYISRFMAPALEQAEAAAQLGEVPVGAVLVDPRSGEIVAAAHNRDRALCDPTAHAEMLVIRAASTARQSQRLGGLDLFVTLEPCAMCAAAISFARIRRLYYGATDLKGGAVDSGGRFFGQPSCHHAPEVYGGIADVASTRLLRDFFAARR